MPETLVERIKKKQTHKLAHGQHLGVMNPLLLHCVAQTFVKSECVLLEKLK